MVKCHLKGMRWGYNGLYHCALRSSTHCKLCDLPVCTMHSMPYDNRRICELCMSSLPEKTDGDMIGKDYFIVGTIKRIDHIYLTKTKTCKQ